jgi:hypothetical protein
MPGLTPPALRPLPLATLRPAGWLLERLRLQADGMAGHLDEFWPDIEALVLIPYGCTTLRVTELPMTNCAS